MVTKHKNFVPRGVIPACLLPFHDDLTIDEASFTKHLTYVAAAPGISAITINAHSTEVASCTLDEQARVLGIAQIAIGDKIPLVHGVYAEGSLEAARIAAQATKGGAAALLVFPPGLFTMGHRPEMVIAHYQRIADASELPIIAFNYPLGTGQGYTTEMIVELARAVPSVRAIKDWCAQPVQHERNVRVLQALSPAVHVLSTHSAWLLGSLVSGCDGLLSGSGSVIADWQAQLFAAVRSNDLATARRVNDAITPLAEVFYASPAVDMHNRMKQALVLLGRIPSAAVRPPLVKLPAAEIARIRATLIACGLLGADGRSEPRADQREAAE